MEEQVYQLIDGKAVAAQAKKELAAEVANIKQAGGKIPHLAAILVGHDGGSETYVMNKVKSCEAIGFRSSTTAERRRRCGRFYRTASVTETHFKS